MLLQLRPENEDLVQAEGFRRRGSVIDIPYTCYSRSTARPLQRVRNDESEWCVF